jgi:hypothetical protein
MVIGGADSTGVALSDAWSYPIWFETGTWYARPPLPAARYGADGSGSDVMIIAAGATNDSTFHDDSWLLSGPSWDVIPPFAGGERRGGVAAGFLTGEWWMVDFYYGLGLDGSLQRHKDWWRLVQQTGIPSAALQDPSIFPDPGTSSFTLRLPFAVITEVVLTDARGRVALRTRNVINGTVATDGLEPGLYLVSASDPSGRNCTARWIKQ